MTATPLVLVEFEPAWINFTVIIGNTWPLLFVLGTENVSGVFTPDDLTGAVAKLRLYDNAGVFLNELPVVITPQTGLIDATIEYRFTQVDWGTARYELQVTYANGTRRTEVAGRLTTEREGQIRGR